ncbi:MAG: sensor domain-containing diguanylate cyclase [Bacteroidota bacterium]
MPENKRGIAFQSVFSKISLQEGVVAGIGVLLFFLGLWSAAILTKLFCFIITGIAAYYVLDSLRGRRHPPSDNDSSIPADSESDDVENFRTDRAETGEEAVDEQFDRRKSDIFSEHAIAENRAELEDKEIRFEEPAQRAHDAIVYSPSDFVDDEQALIEGGRQEPRSEFNFLLQKTLSVIKEVVFANSVSFFWVNQESQQLILEAKFTDSQVFSTSRKLPIGSDIVSQIALSGKPEIMGQIAANAERDIVPYYASLEEIKSFIGVPVFYPSREGERLPVAVLAIDSKADDAYGPETVDLLAKFTKMLSAVLKSSTEKYDLLNESGVLKTEMRFRAKAFGESEIANIGNALAEEVSTLVPWDALVLILFDGAQKQWVVANVRTRHNHRYVVAKQLLDFHSSVAGKAIKNNAVQDIDDLSKTSEPRFLVNESSLGMARVGSFVAIPIASTNKCYGALTLECREKNSYGSKEISSVSQLTSIAGIAFELREANDIIKEFVVVDESTGTTSKKYFLQRLSEEWQRADDDGSDVSLLLFAISSLNDIVARYGRAGSEAAVARIASILRSSVRPYDVIGRFDHAIFAVVLVKTTSNDAYLWAEKLRSAIASTVVSFEQKTFSVTVTVGICGAAEGMDSNECVSNTVQVLEKAKEAGGNIVRVF